MIIVEDVHKRYLTDHGPGMCILLGVSFTIPVNVNVGLVGRNGAGKSTLLRLIGVTDMRTRVVHRDGSFEDGDAKPRVRSGDEVLVLPKVDVKSRQVFKDMTQIIYQIAMAASVVLRL